MSAVSGSKVLFYQLTLTPSPNVPKEVQTKVKEAQTKFNEKFYTAFKSLTSDTETLDKSDKKKYWREVVTKVQEFAARFPSGLKERAKDLSCYIFDQFFTSLKVAEVDRLKYALNPESFVDAEYESPLPMKDVFASMEANIRKEHERVEKLFAEREKAEDYIIKINTALDKINNAIKVVSSINPEEQKEPESVNAALTELKKAKKSAKEGIFHKMEFLRWEKWAVRTDVIKPVADLEDFLEKCLKAYPSDPNTDAMKVELLKQYAADCEVITKQISLMHPSLSKAELDAKFDEEVPKSYSATWRSRTLDSILNIPKSVPTAYIAPTDNQQKVENPPVNVSLQQTYKSSFIRVPEDTDNSSAVAPPQNNRTVAMQTSDVVTNPPVTSTSTTSSTATNTNGMTPSITPKTDDKVETPPVDKQNTDKKDVNLQKDKPTETKKKGFCAWCQAKWQSFCNWLKNLFKSKK